MRGKGGGGLISSLFFFFFDAWSSPFRETKKKLMSSRFSGAGIGEMHFVSAAKEIFFLRNYLVVCVVERRVSPFLPKRILLCAGTL